MHHFQHDPAIAAHVGEDPPSDGQDDNIVRIEPCNHRDWYNDYGSIVSLYKYLAREGWTQERLEEFLEQPYRYTDEWNEFQRSRLRSG